MSWLRNGVHRIALIIVVCAIVVAQSVGCGSAPTSAQMAKTLTDKLVPEQHHIDLTCSDLAVERSSGDLRKVLASGPR
jgi:hypothetical protein